MKLNLRATACGISVLGLLMLGQGVAAAAPAWGGRTTTCTGTLTSPGELSGSYANLVIDGACAVQSGPVRVNGNLTVEPDGILNADFGSNGSRISIGGNLIVQQNAS